MTCISQRKKIQSVERAKWGFSLWFMEHITQTNLLSANARGHTSRRQWCLFIDSKHLPTLCTTMHIAYVCARTLWASVGCNCPECSQLWHPHTLCPLHRSLFKLRSSTWAHLEFYDLSVCLNCSPLLSLICCMYTLHWWQIPVYFLTFGWRSQDGWWVLLLFIKGGGSNHGDYQTLAKRGLTSMYR